MNEDVRQQAEADYISGMKYKEIAEKYGVTINTVKSWKTRYQWSRDDKKVCTQKRKKCAHKNKEKKADSLETEMLSDTAAPARLEIKTQRSMDSSLSISLRKPGRFFLSFLRRIH